MSDTNTFREEIQRKIKNLLGEFGAGKISNEQFNILYERYNNQLSLANRVAEGSQDEAEGGEMSTIAIREATSGKAVGMGIYHHRSGTMVETLGNFDISPSVMSPVLNEFSDKLENNEFIEPRTMKLDDKSGLWVIFVAKIYTTAVLLFRNEPSPVQLRDIQRLLHDFEIANQRFLDKHTVEPEKLGSPFLGIVRRKMK